MSKFTNIAS